MHAVGKKQLTSIVMAAFTILHSWAYGQEVAPLHLNLEKSVALALEYNESLQTARREQGKAQQQIREARAAALPQVDASFDYARNWKLPTFVFDTPIGPEQVKIGTDYDFAGVLSLRQPLYTSGKVGASLQVARLFATAAAEQVREREQEVRSVLEQAFYDLLLSRELVRVSDQALVRARANLARVQSLRQGGRVAEYDLLRARVQVSQMIPDSLRAHNQLELAAMTFKDAVGIDLEQQVEVAGSFRQETTLDLDAAKDLVRLGWQRRPELRQAEHQVEMFQRAEKIARAESRPSLDLYVDGRLQVQSREFSFWEEEARKSWTTGLTVTLPLFNGFRTGAQVAQVREDERRARLVAAQLKRRIQLQIRRAQLNLQEGEARIAAHRDALGQAEAGLRLATSRYGGGAGTQLEILDAQLALTRAQTDLARARRDRAVALVRLEVAVGVMGASPDSGKE